MSAFEKFLYSFILLVWILIGLYFGVAGYTVLKIEESKTLAEISKTNEKVSGPDGLTFKNKYYLEAYKQEIRATSIFPYFKGLPDVISFLMTACAFGILGGFTRVIKFIAIDEKSLQEIKTKILVAPVLGAMTGFIMLGLASIVPQLLISGEGVINPISIVFLCFFAGLYSKRFFTWLSKNIGKLFGDYETNPATGTDTGSSG